MVKVKQMDKAKVKDEAEVHDAFSLSLPLFSNVANVLMMG